MRLLIIRPGAIGDTLLVFPLLRTLREREPELSITFVGNAAVLPLLQALELAQEVADFQDSRWSRLFFTHAPDMQQPQETWEQALCWLRDPDGIVARNVRAMGVQRCIIAPGRPADGVHQHITAYLAQTAGIDWTFPTHMPAFSLPGTTIAETPRAIAIHPGSGGAHKCWPIERFAAIIRALWQQQVPVLLLAGPADHARVAELQRLLPLPPANDLLNTLIEVPLLTVATHLQACRGYLGNDSGLTHLAALLGLPTLALFGPSDPHVWHPVGPAVTVLHEPTLEDISVARVLDLCWHFPACRKCA